MSDAVGAMWPKWVYPEGKPAVIVHDEDEEARVMSSKPPPADADDTGIEEDDIDALRASAEALGIDIDRRWGVQRLRQVIDDHTR